MSQRAFTESYQQKTNDGNMSSLSNQTENITLSFLLSTNLQLITGHVVGLLVTIFM